MKKNVRVSLERIEEEVAFLRKSMLARKKRTAKKAWLTMKKDKKKA